MHYSIAPKYDFPLIPSVFQILIRNQIAEMALNLESIDDCIQDLIDLTEDYKQLEVENYSCILVAFNLIINKFQQATHKNYTVKLEELSNLQTKCVKDIAHQRYRLGIIKSTLKK